jgi:hypothetical protein
MYILLFLTKIVLLILLPLGRLDRSSSTTILGIKPQPPALKFQSHTMARGWRINFPTRAPDKSADIRRSTRAPPFRANGATPASRRELVSFELSRRTSSYLHLHYCCREAEMGHASVTSPAKQRRVSGRGQTSALCC